MKRKGLRGQVVGAFAVLLSLLLCPVVAAALVISGDNVGIGTTNPTQPLEINGNIKFTNGVLMFPDNTTQSTATLQGPKGDKGDQGPIGLRGPVGPQGPVGPPGNYNYTRTVFVGPVGTTIENGTALLNALAGISASSTNPSLLKIEPGIYDLGAATLFMKPYVDVEGSGEKTTKIAGRPDGPVVMGASDAEIRFLTVENTGGGSNSIAIGNWNASPKITNVTANASGVAGFTAAINNWPSASPTITNVVASASGGTNCNGISNGSGSAPYLVNVAAFAVGCSDNNNGVYSKDSPTNMINVIANASGGAFSYGIFNDSSNVQMYNVLATASGATNNNGIQNVASAPHMRLVKADATGGANSNGIFNDASNAQMHDVIATASGATDANMGIVNNSSVPLMRLVKAEASGGTYCNGIFNNSSNAQMNNVMATASGGTYNNGVNNNSSVSNMRYVKAVASGGTNSNGIFNDNCSPFTMAFIEAYAHDATGFNAAINNTSSSPIMSNVFVSVFPGRVGSAHNGIFNSASSPTIESATIIVPTAADVCGGGCFGVWSTASGNVRVDNSQIYAFSNTLWSGDGVATYAGNTKLVGGPAYKEGTGTLKCVGVYKGSYDPLANNCQEP